MSLPECSQTAKYFDAHPDLWDIADYLDLCGLEYGIAISRWRRSLEAIANDPGQAPERRKRAQLLHDKYPTEDRTRARNWRKAASAAAAAKRGGLTVYRGPVITAGGNVHYNSVGNKRSGPAKDAKRKRPKTTGKGKNLVTEPPIELFTDGDSDSEGDESGGFSGSLSPDDNYLSEAFDGFQSAYKNMRKKTQFLNSTKVFEDVIYQEVVALFKKEPSALNDNLILSWIIDLDSEFITERLLADELLQLKSWRLPLPEMEGPFAFSLGRFSKAQEVAEFRDITENIPCRQGGTPHDPLQNSDATYVNVAIDAVLSVVDFRKRYSKSFLSNLREGWFDSNVWGPLIDRCMQGLDGVLLNRKEIRCDALMPTADKRFDAIFQAPDDEGSPEFGAIEVLSSVKGPPQKKNVTDNAKLVIGLHAMLRRLHQLVDNDEDTIRSQQVIGILNTGFQIQIFRMNSLNTDVFLLDRGKERTVPTTAEEIKAIPGVIQGICCAKYMIQDCVAVTRRYIKTKASNTDFPAKFEL